MHKTSFSLLIASLISSQLFSQDLFDVNSYEESQSCMELYETIQKSDCIKQVNGFLKGANIKIGIALAKQTMTIEDTETEEEIASMDGDFVPAPYYALSTKKSFFGHSDFGYEFGFSYSNSYALNQSLNEEKSREDLGTYSTITMVTFNPTLFYAYGAQDASPNTYFGAGIGVGAGYAQARGTAYVTENVDPASPCGIAVANFEEGDQTAINAIKSNCKNISYNESGFGYSARIFIEGRWKNFYTSIDASNVVLQTEAYHYTPQNTVWTFAYIVDIN